MSNNRRLGRDFWSGQDPRAAGGDIAGPGGPHDRHGVVLDARNAVLLEDTTVSLAHQTHTDGTEQTGIALMLEGRINRTTERSRVLYLMNTDGAAAIITELLALAQRADGDIAADLRRRVAALTVENLNRPADPS